MQVRQKREKKSLKFRISFIILFLTASLVGSLTLFLKNNQPESYYRSGGEILEETLGSSLVRENEPKTARYFRKCYFAAGEIPEKMAEYGFIPRESLCFSEEASAVYVFSDSSDDLSEYVSFVNKDSVRIYFVSKVPAVSSEENALIDAENQKIRDFCEENGYLYIDVNSYMKNKEGNLPEILYSEGGLSREAYGRITEYLLSHTVD